MLAAGAEARPERVSVVVPCFNEVDNVGELHARIAGVLEGQGVEWELIFIDNASTDGTREAIVALIARDPRVRLIVNVRNFGPVRSPYHGLLQASGEAVILMAADMQDPPELLPSFLARWREGARIVLAVKESSEESPVLYAIRTAYYRLISRLSQLDITRHATGFGLYDRVVMDALREIPDTYPYFRGLIHELGFPMARVTFRQPQRRRGLTKNNFYTLYDQGMLGITNHSKVPLRIATMVGFLVGACSLVVAFGYLVAKLLLWGQFPNIGQAPTVIGLFFFSSVQLFFIGLLGEYVLAIHTQVHRRPRVVELERVNFPEINAVVEPPADGARV
ncbi:MAG: glycosyltransferase family 2 protein [Candidatus Sericytochromatia bacterium]|nr:glycosyltransferase family 2 protein [Candidatus Sericytochromatia bacterium]